MRKTIVYIIILFGLLILVLTVPKNRRYIYHLIPQKKEITIEQNREEPVLAIFSLDKNVQHGLVNRFPHLKVILTEGGKWEIDNNLIAGIADSIPVMITVETWNGSGTNKRFSNPLERLEKGYYDEFIKYLCEELIGERPNVFIRFDPEMEVPTKRFSWQYYGGSAYIRAFRHFVELCKTYSPNIKIVWGPAGYPGAMEYYPGNDVVDVATITIKSGSEQSLNVYPKNYPIKYDVFRRLHRLRFIDKPVFILGSHYSSNDSVNMELVHYISKIISEEQNIIYSNRIIERTGYDTVKRNKGGLEIGLYDPQSLLNNEEPVTVEHLFVDFSSLENGKFECSFREIIKRRHDIIVTFEPFRLPGGKTDLKVLQNITAGNYDHEIEQLYTILAKSNRRVYLRYAHEMEIPITRYPWQSQNPVDYIHSFRYFMSFLNPLPDNIQRVWGPAGDRGAMEWYPGDDIVDFISIAIYGLPDKNITNPEKQESFEQIFNRKFWRLRFIEKPLFITEFGVKGPEDYQTKWLEGAAKVIRENPQIIGVSYFNMSDTPKAWGDIKPPDWSITASSLHRFVEVLKKDNY